MNKITCICLGVRSMEKSIKFYRDKLGFQTDETGNNPDLDGYYWEVAWGPNFKYDDNSMLVF